MKAVTVGWPALWARVSSPVPKPWGVPLPLCLTLTQGRDRRASTLDYSVSDCTVWLISKPLSGGPPERKCCVTSGFPHGQWPWGCHQGWRWCVPSPLSPGDGLLTAALRWQSRGRLRGTERPWSSVAASQRLVMSPSSSGLRRTLGRKSSEYGGGKHSLLAPSQIVFYCKKNPKYFQVNLDLGDFGSKKRTCKYIKWLKPAK